jgi:hypothetical protein
MPKADEQEPERDAKTAGQVELIVRAFHDRGIVVRPVFEHRGLAFMYEAGAILVRDEYLRRVEEIVGLDGETGEPARDDGEPDAESEADDSTRGTGPRVQRVIRGVVRLSLAGTPFGGEGAGVLAALDEIDAELGTGAATPNQVLTAAGVVHPCPATEPAEVPEGIEPYPGVCPGHDGGGVRVYLADTGLLAGAPELHSWLHGVEGDLEPLADPGDIPPYTGHGTFVAGVLRCMAPAAEIYVADVFNIAGSALESQAVPKLSAALELGFDIFHLTIAAPTRKSLPLAAFDAWRRELRQYHGVVCVVAAGNSGSSKPFWPAAFPEMVSVGALAADWRSRASFSNYGGWVDVYAPGRDLINAYATGAYTCRDYPYTDDVRDFYGMASWSGTSFSTPIVSGLIAARMSRAGENGQQAAAALLAIARSQAVPGVGAILRPCLDDNGGGCGCGPAQCSCGPAACCGSPRCGRAR